MRGQFVACFVVIGGCAICITAGCSQAESPPPAPASTQSSAGSQVISDIGLGRLTAHTYTHDYFNLSVTIPDEWYIQNRRESDRLMQAGVAAFRPDDQPAVQMSQQYTLNLLSAFRHPPGTPDVSNHSLMLMAEDVSILPGLKHGQDFLYTTRQSMAKITTIKFECGPIETGFKIGSLPAARMQVVIFDTSGQEVYQDYYAARRGDYFLAVVLSYSDDDELDSLLEIMESLKAR